MQQDVFLFSGSVRDNVRLGDESINQARVEEAARFVNADRFIGKLPNRYEQVVAEGGSTLSSGQRQLLSFARALAFNPEILILDEATSSIDTETEQLIQDAIAKLMHDRTSIVIAHRLSTIRSADKSSCYTTEKCASWQTRRSHSTGGHLRAPTSAQLWRRRHSNRLRLAVLARLPQHDALQNLYGIDNLIARYASLTHDFAARPITSVRRRQHAHGRSIKHTGPSPPRMRRSLSILSAADKIADIHFFSFLGVCNLHP